MDSRNNILTRVTTSIAKSNSSRVASGLAFALFVASSSLPAEVLAKPPRAHSARECAVDCEAHDILDQLAAIDGLEVQEVESPTEGYRAFEMTLLQPEDHSARRSAYFPQQVVLLHKSTDAPTILHTSGYFIIPASYGPIPLAQNLGANELRVEHRFFGDSRPDSGDWSLLTHRQSADDLHRVVRLIRPIYEGKWISTGFSKGGMTATYFRRFYPNDVDATVAYVAPLSFGRADPRYARFLDGVGNAACRQRLRAYQAEVLRRRPAMIEQLRAFSENTGLTYDLAEGGFSQALDHAVGEAYFTFWQYYGEPYCDYVPATDASDDDLFWFLQAVGTATVLSDFEIELFQPYYVQAVRQLGYPDLGLAHLKGLLQFDPNSYTQYIQDAQAGKFDWLAMLDVYYWVAQRGTRMMFIYGDADPWSAGAYFVPTGGRRHMYKFFAAGGTHLSDLDSLDERDREQAIATIEDWADASWSAPVQLQRKAPVGADFVPHVDHKLDADERDTWLRSVRDILSRRTR